MNLNPSFHNQNIIWLYSFTIRNTSHSEHFCGDFWNRESIFSERASQWYMEKKNAKITRKSPPKMHKIRMREEAPARSPQHTQSKLTLIIHSLNIVPWWWWNSWVEFLKRTRKENEKPFRLLNFFIAITYSQVKAKPQHGGGDGGNMQCNLICVRMKSERISRHGCKQDWGIWGAWPGRIGSNIIRTSMHCWFNIIISTLTSYQGEDMTKPNPEFSRALWEFTFDEVMKIDDKTSFEEFGWNLSLDYRNWKVKKK